MRDSDRFGFSDEALRRGNHEVSIRALAFPFRSFEIEFRGLTKPFFFSQFLFGHDARNACSLTLGLGGEFAEFRFVGQ